MAKAKSGDRVRFDFVGTLDDGTVFDTTREAAEDTEEGCSSDDCGCDSNDCSDDCGCGEVGPMELVLGSGEFFPQIESALIGLAPGDKTTVRIAAVDAFGDYEDEKVFTVGRAELPDDLDPEEGDELVLTDENDESIGVVVLEKTPESITFDANHPLAGEDLLFELELVEIVAG